MTCSLNSKTILIAALVLVSACLLPAKADVRAVNQCPHALTVFYQSQGSGRRQLTLASGTSAQLGLPRKWTGGVMWASRHANGNNGQCTQLEFNIGAKEGRDYYDISLINAYNEPAMINPTFLAGGDTRKGLECGTVSCTIPNLSTVCRLHNKYAGPDKACINTDGPGLVDTKSIDLFRNACPHAYVQSNDNTNVVYGCKTGSNYDAIWCP